MFEERSLGRAGRCRLDKPGRRLPRGVPPPTSRTSMKPSILIVGAGLYGAACARELHDAGHRVLVIEQRDAPGGNCATRYVEEADCHEHLVEAWRTTAMARRSLRR